MVVESGLTVHANQVVPDTSLEALRQDPTEPAPPAEAKQVAQEPDEALNPGST